MKKQYVLEIIFQLGIRFKNKTVQQNLSTQQIRHIDANHVFLWSTKRGRSSQNLELPCAYAQNLNDWASTRFWRWGVSRSLSPSWRATSQFRHCNFSFNCWGSNNEASILG